MKTVRGFKTRGHATERCPEKHPGIGRISKKSKINCLVTQGVFQ